MYHDETIAAVARKFYHLNRRDVAELLDVLVEIWQEALLEPNEVIHIKGLGKLHVDEQEVTTTGAVQKLLEAKGKEVPATMKRYYFRFHPSDTFKQRLVEFRKLKGDNPHE